MNIRRFDRLQIARYSIQLIFLAITVMGFYGKIRSLFFWIMLGD